MFDHGSQFQFLDAYEINHHKITHEFHLSCLQMVTASATSNLNYGGS